MNYRNQRILNVPKHGDVPCCYCGIMDGTIVAAHSNQGRHGKGFGIKAHDCFVAFLCNSCHTFVDQGKADQDIKQSVWQAAHVKSLPWLWHALDAKGMELLKAVGDE